MQIDSSTILVTGGSSGLGAACVEMLARRGAYVIVADLAPPRGGVSQRFADRVLFARTDVTSEADVRAAIAAGEKRFGPLRGVVACAGVLHAERVLGREGVASLEAFRRVIDINLERHVQHGSTGGRSHRAERTAGGRPPRRGGDDVIGLGVRRPDRPGGVLGVERRRRVAHVAAGSRVGPARHPCRLDRAGRLRHADDASRAG